MKNILRLVGECYRKVALPFMYLSKFENRFHIYSDNKKLRDRNILDIVTVSLNNESVILYQIKFLKMNMKDPFFYTVLDNSTDRSEQKKIIKICKKFKVGYIKAPFNPCTYIFPSASHGSSINWVYRKYLSPRGAKYWGIIDHDIFPVKPTKIIPILDKQPIYGHLQKRDDLWYLWPGFCFFNTDKTRDVKMNFMPLEGADTGSRNYEPFYSKLNLKGIKFPIHKYSVLRKGDTPQSDMVEYIDGWLHTFNASNWRKVENREEKEKLIKKLLDKYLKN